MSLIIGGVTMPDPIADNQISYELVGQRRRAADGTLLTGYTAIKRKWAYNWEGLTTTERNTIKAKYISGGSLVGSVAMTTADGEAVGSVVITEYSETATGEFTRVRWDVEVTIEEA